ncbi:MAG: tetratricopeptide repeat protein [Ignavibacteriaceae bacterium]|nr:tetratricopeptide repeat protein [Ignavibacteriaceae bacterium]
MARYKIIFFSLIVLVCYKIQAQTYPDAKVDSLLKSGIKNIVNQNYNSAEKIFTVLDKEYSHLPLGKIYLAANRIAEAYDYAQDFDENYILSNLETAKQQSENLIDSDNNNIWYRYFYSLTEGYISYYDALKGSWFSALSKGINSISGFEDILNEDKNFYEAYIAIGTFEYWKSRKMEFMSWLPFSDDTKNFGIDLLTIAVDSSSYNSHLAVNSLIWIYIDQKKYNEAISLAAKALKEFPESRNFKWGLARAYEDKNPVRAIELYLEILDSYPQSLKNNYKNKITLKHLIAQQYAKLGNKKQALNYCNEILSLKNIPEKTLDEISGRLDRVKSLKNELSKEN